MTAVFIKPLYSNGFPIIHIDTVGMGLPIVYFKGSQADFFLNHDVFLSLKFD